MKKESQRRILGRKLAKNLTAEQLKSIAGGSVSISGGEYDDGDIAY